MNNSSTTAIASRMHWMWNASHEHIQYYACCCLRAHSNHHNNLTATILLQTAYGAVRPEWQVTAAARQPGTTQAVAGWPDHTAAFLCAAGQTAILSMVCADDVLALAAWCCCVSVWHDVRVLSSQEPPAHGCFALLQHRVQLGLLGALSARLQCKIKQQWQQHCSCTLFLKGTPIHIPHQSDRHQTVVGPDAAGTPTTRGTGSHARRRVS